MDASIPTLLHWLALPEFGLSTVFVIALISATLLPMGSEPAVVGLLQLRPDLFWPAILVATAGNTLGGMISWWLGRMAHQAWQATHPAAAAKAAAMHPQRSRHKQLAHAWLVRWGGQNLLAQLVADCGRPFVCRGRVAAPAVLGLLRVHGDRQILALCADDQCRDVGTGLAATPVPALSPHLLPWRQVCG